MAEEKVALENDRIANTGAPFGGPGPGMSNRGNEQYNNEYEGAPYHQGNYRGNNFSQGNYRGNYQGYPQDNYRGNFQGQGYPKDNFRGSYQSQGYPQGYFRGSYQSQGYPQDNFRGDYRSQGYPHDDFRGDYRSQGYPQDDFRGNYQGQVYPRGSYRSGYFPFGGRSAVGNYPYGTRHGYPYRDHKDRYDHDDDYYHDYDYDDYHYYQKYVPLGYGPYGQPYGGCGRMKQRPFGSLRNWISYNPVTNWARGPRGNNFLRGLGIATAGIILAPAIIRTIRPLAVQAVHGAMSIVGEMKGVVSDAREELEDIFADAKWENMNSREEKLQEG